MAEDGKKKSQADIAREWMIEHARQARESWTCDRCATRNESNEDFCVQCGADGRPFKLSAMPSARPRFPSAPETRRAILDAIATKNDKYARPFDHGRVAVVSLIGTESWSDYGDVVLQMAILDTLLSIEGKLEALIDRPSAQEQGEPT
jgi:hypothetical protein